MLPAASLIAEIQGYKHNIIESRNEVTISLLSNEQLQNFEYSFEGNKKRRRRRKEGREEPRKRNSFRQEHFAIQEKYACGCIISSLCPHPKV
jgi:hypothetical protein